MAVPIDRPRATGSTSSLASSLPPSAPALGLVEGRRGYSTPRPPVPEQTWVGGTGATTRKSDFGKSGQINEHLGGVLNDGVLHLSEGAHISLLPGYGRADDVL